MPPDAGGNEVPIPWESLLKFSSKWHWVQPDRARGNCAEKAISGGLALLHHGTNGKHGCDQRPRVCLLGFFILRFLVAYVGCGVEGEYIYIKRRFRCGGP